MATFNFNTSLGQTLTFNPAADILSIGYPALEVTLTQDGANTVVTVAGVGSVTLAGTTVGQLHSTGTAANIGVAGGTLLIGDETVSDALDAAGNTTAAIAAATDAKVYGMGGGDTLNVSGATTGSVVVFGGTGITDTTDGGDTITVATGNATVYGNSGNDAITLGATAAGKNVSVWGGLDNDTVNGGATVLGSTTTIDLGAGNDTFTAAAASAGTLDVKGGVGNDTITMNATTVGDATVYGGTGGTDTADGADTITLTAHNAVVYANAGADTVTVAGKANGTSLVHGGIDNDSITNNGTAMLGAHTIFGGFGTDTITIDAVGGDDNATSILVYGGNGLTDTVDGADTIAVTNHALTTSIGIYGNAGNDAITLTGTTAGAFAATLHGGLGNDTITYTADAAGNDTITGSGGAGSDTFNFNLNGGAANTATINDFSSADDVLNLRTQAGSAAAGLTVSRGSSSVVVADAATNTLSLTNFGGNFTATNFTINGGTTRLLTNFDGAAASLAGAGGADQLIAGGNGDTLNGGDGADKLLGGNGADTFQFTGAQANATANTFGGDTITGGNGADTISISGTDVVTLTNLSFVNATGIEKIQLTGSAAHNIVTGANGATTGIKTVDASVATVGVTINMTSGTDTTILGGAGNDTLTGGTGTSHVTAGAGSDILTLTGAIGASTLLGGTGTDTVSGATGTVTLDGTAISSFEVVRVDATNAANVTVGASYGATLEAAASLTIAVTAGATASKFDASALTSNAAILTGAAGIDTLIGGAGADTLTGGDEVDILTGGTGRDSFNYTDPAHAGATITDFAVGTTGDELYIDTSAYGTFGLNGALFATGNQAAIQGAAANNTVFVFTGGTGYANVAAAELIIQTGNAATTDYVMVFLNSTTGFAEAYFDASSAVVGSSVLLATFSNITTVEGLAGFVNENFTTY